MKRTAILVGQLVQLVTLLGAFSGGTHGFLPTTISRNRRRRRQHVGSSVCSSWRNDDVLPLGLSAAMRDCDHTAAATTTGPTSSFIDSNSARRRRILQSFLTAATTVIATTMAASTSPLVAQAGLLEEFGTDPKSIQSKKPPPAAAAAAAEATPAKAVAIDPTLRGCK
jgi:hypothetical protein